MNVRRLRLIDSKIRAEVDSISSNHLSFGQKGTFQMCFDYPEWKKIICMCNRDSETKSIKFLGIEKTYLLSDHEIL